MLYCIFHYLWWEVISDFLTMCVCVCVSVSGVIEEKGRENGREKRTPKNTIGSEVGDFCRLHYTQQLRGQKYMYS